MLSTWYLVVCTSHYYRIQKPFVDETMVEEDDVSLDKEKSTVVLKENVVKAIFDGVKSREASMASSNKAVEVVDLGESDEEEEVVNKEVKVKKVRVEVKNIKDIEKAIERERLERVEKEIDVDFGEFQSVESEK